MKNKSLLEEIEDCNFENRINDVLPMLENEYHLYGTISLIKQLYHCLKLLLEKQIPKKPMIGYDERVKENWCSCGVCAFGFGWKRTIHYKYCPDCGQKLDWSDAE